MNIYKGYLTSLFLIVITVIVIDLTELTINYSLFTRPSSTQSSLLATPLAYFDPLNSLSTFIGLMFGR